MGKIEQIEGIAFDGGIEVAAHGTRQVVSLRIRVTAPIVFAPRIRLTVRGGSFEGASSNEEAGVRLPWLPRGAYRVEVALPGALPAGQAHVAIETFHTHAMQEALGPSLAGNLQVQPHGVGAAEPMRWTVEAIPPTPALASLSWSQGDANWFYRHFDHAAPTVISYLLGNHPLLRGRILDIGCGDGITDLGIALRTGCEQLVGVEPFRQYERLPSILADHHLPADLVPSNLRFVAEDANFLPFPDDSFDVVVSWGSLEHIAGGYLQALREVKRVLRPEGLFMAAPGLFYSNIGHHLGEFCEEPFFHLKMPREEIRRMVLATPPRYIDRSGEFASNEQYWQWFTELNPITVARFEQEMRALEFRPWRIALRTDNLVEYTPQIEHYPIQDLANTELYSSWISRKKKR
jgi:SAM-dependent methyltransferase